MRLDEAFARLNIVRDYIPAGNSNRPGTKLTPSRITIHNTDNPSPGANAAAHAKYQKGPDARARQVSWHFTVDDIAVFQSLPTNEVGWHAGSSAGNSISLGIEICMNPEMDEAAGYDRSALLTAVMARAHGISVPSGIVQHNHWTGKNCPRVLRERAGAWQAFLDAVTAYANDLEDPAATDLVGAGDHLEGEAIPTGAAPGTRFTTIASDGLRIRGGAGTEFEVRSVLPFGTRVVVLSRSGDWALIDATGDGGADGFVYSAYLKPA